MTTGLISFLASSVYILGTMVTARILHIRAYREWMRWKNSIPDAKSKLEKIWRDNSYGGSGYYTVPRPNVSLYDFMRGSKGYIGRELTPRGAAFLWPFFAPYWAVVKFCFPEPKIPDQNKIAELEDLAHKGDCHCDFCC